MTRFYCGNTDCEHWEEYSPMRETNEGHCTRDDTQINRRGICDNYKPKDAIQPYRYIISFCPVCGTSFIKQKDQLVAIFECEYCTYHFSIRKI